MFDTDDSGEATALASDGEDVTCDEFQEEMVVLQRNTHAANQQN